MVKKFFIKFLKWLLRIPQPLPLKDFAPAEPQAGIGSKAYYAEQMLSNPLYKEVMQRIESQTIEKWRNTHAGDTESREKFYIHLQALKQIETFFRIYINEQDIRKAEKQFKDHRAEQSAMV